MLAAGIEADAPIHPQARSIIQLERILQSQGFGSRKQSRQLIESGRVLIDGLPCRDPQREFATENLRFTVDDRVWQFRDKVYLMLHKPPGYECSRNPQHHPSVLSLLPLPLMERGVQPVGRLDEDTSGLLLLSDDGPWLHRLTHPKRHVPKRYLAGLKHPVDPALIGALQQGVLLHGETETLAAREVRAEGTHGVWLTIDQGKYHQVKRMVAAAGNRVENLHRQTFGRLELGALRPGEWCYLTPEQCRLAAEADG